MKIGFIGLGMMGRGMAANLLRQHHQLVVYDLSPAAVRPFADQGAQVAVSPLALAREVDLVFTSLPTPADVLAVYNSETGLGAGFRKGSAWFDFSTNSVDVVRDLAAQLQPKGVDFLDAPISGGPSGAANGKLAIWIGGSQSAFDHHKPILDSLADQVRYIGAIGSGTITKLAHNMASTAIKAVLAEVLTMGVKAGMEPLHLWEAMRSGAAGRMRGFDNIQRFLAGTTDQPSFALKLMQKDIQLALQLGREFDVPMRICAAVGQDIHEAMSKGLGAHDSQAVLVLQQERAGIPPIQIAESELKRVLAQG
ncbi:MAG: NAD(P)-dependent oxidoreductase [Methylocystaceae bacterium]|nr:NAD(P)-dependent oxidoreductase [Methylocystaceae bacterium]